MSPEFSKESSGFFMWRYIIQLKNSEIKTPSFRGV